MVALVDGVPRTLGLLPIVKNYVDHQRDVIVRRTKHELREREARLHILEGLLIAISDIDAVIELIRASSDPEVARDGLMERFELTRIQAQAILDMRLARLTALEADKVQPEHADILERIKELRDDPRRRGPRDGAHQGGAARDPRSLRRRPAHADHASPRTRSTSRT